MAQTIYPEAEELVRKHEADGHVVAIVSGATKFVVRPLAQRLGIEHLLYTRLEVEDGCFTGRVIEPICFEEGKIYWLQQFIEEHGIDLAKSWFYTDSITDLPLLDLVGHPVATNPDPLLYRAAVRRRWPVRFFEPPRRSRTLACGSRARRSPRAISFLIIASKSALGRAPWSCWTTLPFWKARMVGIARTPYLPGVFGFASMSIFTILTCSPQVAARSLMIGAIWRQGAHHSAQKSMIAGLFDLGPRPRSSDPSHPARRPWRLLLR